MVGEREITGQVRRALAAAQAKAQEDGVSLPGELVQLFEHAAHTARQVGQHTALGAQGRSIVSVALDLADEVAEKDWSTRRALIFGTGAYAGATIAALRERGCTDIWVNSRSGRAAEFAAKREVSAVPVDGMEQAMAEADVIIGCSGGSDPLLPEQIPAGHHTILDLALSRDFDPSVADLPHVELITLESVRLAAPEETEESVATATRIVESELAAFVSRQRSRTIDSAIVALRSHTMDVLDSELEKVRNQFGCGAPHGEVSSAHPDGARQEAGVGGPRRGLRAGAGDSLRHSGGGLLRASSPPLFPVFSGIFPAFFARIFTRDAASILLAPGEVPPVHGADGRIHARVDAS